jgi:transcriptional regulator with XRE-family HTH domain
MSTINEKLGKRIKEIRKAQKMSQEELAYQSKTDYSYLNEIEAGKRNPSVKRIDALAKALKVSIRDLFD